jgi:hypothetical protein
MKIIYPTLVKGRCEKIGLVLFNVIPAPYQVRSKLQPESSVFHGLQIIWSPVFTCLREAASAKAGRGDEYGVFFHSFRGVRGGI